MKRAKPFSGVVYCGDCQKNDAEFVLPDSRRVVCAKCAEKAGYSVTWTITNAELAKIRKQLSQKICKKIPRWAWGIMLGMESRNVASLKSAMGRYELLGSHVPVPPAMGQRAVELNAMSKKDIAFELEQAKMAIAA